MKGLRHTAIWFAYLLLLLLVCERKQTKIRMSGKERISNYCWICFFSTLRKKQGKERNKFDSCCVLTNFWFVALECWPMEVVVAAVTFMIVFFFFINMILWDDLTFLQGMKFLIFNTKPTFFFGEIKSFVHFERLLLTTIKKGKFLCLKKICS